MTVHNSIAMPTGKSAAPNRVNGGKGHRLNGGRARALNRKIEILIGEQLNHRQIAERLAPGLEVAPDSIRKRISKVFKALVEADKSERIVYKAQMRETLREHFRWCKARGEAGAACKTADMLCKLDGLYAPVEIKVDALTDDQARRQRIEILVMGSTNPIADAAALAKVVDDASEEPLSN